MLRWTAYVAAVAFISHRLRDRVTLIAAAVPFPVIAMLFIWHITLGRLSYLLYLNSDTLIDLTVLMLVLAVSFVAQPERVKLCLRLTFHAGMLAWFWRVLPGNYDLVYMMVAWAAYAVLLNMVYRLTGHRVALWVGHVVAGVIGTWLIGHIIYGLLTTNPAATPIFNPQGMADLGIIVLVALMYRTLRSDRQLSLIYGLWLHLAVLGWTWQELGLYPNGNGYVTIAWGLYALGLIAAALRLDRNRVLMLCGLSTLFAVAAKLFLIDLRYVDAIWRILLFLGFGGLFLLVSYFFQNVVRRAEGSG
jgi:hypothetical protein